MYKHILVPIDLAETLAAGKAVGVARHIARRDGSRISVISVVPAWPEDPVAEPRDYQPDLDAYIDSVGEDCDIEGDVRVGGSISGRIIETVEEKKIDLVVMASHDPRVTDYLIGSNAAHVVLHASCSVLVVRGERMSIEESPNYKKILIPVDLDCPEATAKAMEVAKAMAHAEGASLTVVSVQPVVLDESGTRPPDYQPKVDAYLARHGEPGEIKGVLKLGGSIPGEIRYTAEDLGSDLIVMGSHDPHFTDYLIGSNAAHVALHTPCSVLVVR